MSLLRSFLSMVVLVCAAPLCAAQWPCPDPGDVYPCICDADIDFDITVDCSNIQSSYDLKIVFQAPFAFNDLKKLIINPVSAFENLTDLPAGVFGPVSFQEIEIINTNIVTMEEEAIVNSHETLVRLNMGRNKLMSFPFETLDLYSVLERLDLSNNMFSGVIPDIVTQKLTYLDLSGNTNFKLTQTVFTDSRSLQELRLNNMGLGDTTPPNVFQFLTDLRTLYLQNNGMTGTLIQDFINTETQPLTNVYLDYNSIDQIHPQSVTGLSPSGTISFTNNQIEELWEENWGELVSISTRPGAIDMRYNPLVCGCDVIWLLQDPSALAVFDSMTMCDTGILLSDVPLEALISHCPP